MVSDTITIISRIAHKRKESRQISLPNLFIEDSDEHREKIKLFKNEDTEGLIGWVDVYIDTTGIPVWKYNLQQQEIENQRI
eukprot:UN32748